MANGRRLYFFFYFEGGVTKMRQQITQCITACLVGLLWAGHGHGGSVERQEQEFQLVFLRFGPGPVSTNAGQIYSRKNNSVPYRRSSINHIFCCGKKAENP